MKLTQKIRREMKSGFSIFSRFFRIQNHFFPDFMGWLNKMKDPRHQSYIWYSQAVLVTEVLLKCLCGLVTMRAMTRDFNTGAFIRNLGIICGEELEEKPDWQTVNNYLEELQTGELESVRYKMIRKLIRTKQYRQFTIDGAYLVIIDGTDFAFFRKKHCEHDLVKKIKNTETGEETNQYYHKALEAKVILGPDLVLSIATEFIENEDEDVTKQDCELSAGYRLLEKLKSAFPRQKFIIAGDALYAAMPFMKAVSDNKWEYIFRIKSGRQEKLTEDFHDLLTQIDDENIIRNLNSEEKGTVMFVNHVEEVTNKPQICNMIQYEYEDKGGKKTFQWVTSMTVTKENAGELVQAGRDRWKIENNGFNVQKNGIYELEHHCSLNWNAMKNHYLLIQISEIFRQLLEAYDDVIYRLNEGTKHLAYDLLMSIAGKVITDQEIEYVFQHTALHMRCCLI